MKTRVGSLVAANPHKINITFDPANGVLKATRPYVGVVVSLADEANNVKIVTNFGLVTSASEDLVTMNEFKRMTTK